ncbi:MAG: CDP-alcohol phosphatidyltransferase family protein [Verrucomicrobiota bacterium]
MVSVYDLKTRFQALLRPLVLRLAGWGVTPNAITVLALILSLAVGIWLFLAPECRIVYFAYPVFLFVRMALNAIDGMLAREFEGKTRLGAFLNEIGDILSDAALYLPLGFLPGASPALGSVFVVMAISTEFCGLIPQTQGMSRRYDGPMGKSDRALVVGVFFFVAGIWPGVLPAVNPILAVLGLLCAVTCFRRVEKALQE